MTTDSNLRWHEHLQLALTASDQALSLQEEIPFPWNEASTAIAQVIGVSQLTLAPRPSQWRSGSEILHSLGDAPLIISIETTPLETPLIWAMAKEEVSFLCTAALSATQQDSFFDPRFQEGFYRFILLKILHALNGLQVLDEISFRLHSQETPPPEPCLCTDISIALPGKTIYGRLISPQSWMERYQNFQPAQKQQPLSAEKLSALELLLRIEVGSTSISMGEWKTVMPGDFILLDRINYDPIENKGAFTLMLDNTPLLLGRFKPEGAKITDYAFYYSAPEETESEEAMEEPDFGLEEESENPETPAAITPDRLMLSIELSPLKINGEALLNLAPESMLQLSDRPENGVLVFLGSKKVAHGDLIKLGDSIGIRILSTHE
jgi:type III secretion system YscQ/HrcQ family protein